MEFKRGVKTEDKPLFSIPWEISVVIMMTGIAFLFLWMFGG